MSYFKEIAVGREKEEVGEKKKRKEINKKKQQC